MKEHILLNHVLLGRHGDLCDSLDKWKLFEKAAWRAGLPLAKFKAATSFCAFAEQEAGWEEKYSEKLNFRESLGL
jgi:hypothetical protein